MNNYIAMLRGINVSGKKPVPMADLKKVFEDLECRDVRTYIQSGNVIFRREESRHSELAELIEKAIEKRFGFSVPVLLRTDNELNQIIAKNPFSRINDDPTKLFVTFLSGLPTKPIEDTALNSYSGPDEFHLYNEEVYLHCPGGYGKTKLSNTFLEKKLGVTATTRNWKTLLKLAEMTG